MDDSAHADVADGIYLYLDRRVHGPRPGAAGGILARAEGGLDSARHSDSKYLTSEASELYRDSGVAAIEVPSALMMSAGVKRGSVISAPCSSIAFQPEFAM